MVKGSWTSVYGINYLGQSDPVQNQQMSQPSESGDPPATHTHNTFIEQQTTSNKDKTIFIPAKYLISPYVLLNLFFRLDDNIFE